MNGVARVLATGFGIGRIPFAPGTAASVAALPFGIWIVFMGGNWLALAGFAVVFFLLGVWACGVHARALGLKDPGECVLDEIAGQLVALTPLIPTGRMLSPGALLLAFVLFRFFDIVKPWPISRLERLPGGLGIMADDMLAGAVSAGLVWLAAYENWI